MLISLANKTMRISIPKCMYKVIILKRRKGGSDLINELTTITPSLEAAKVAFLEIRKNSDFQGENYIVLMSKDKVKLNVHLFNAGESDPSFFNLDDIVWYENEFLHS